MDIKLNEGGSFNVLDHSGNAILSAVDGNGNIAFDGTIQLSTGSSVYIAEANRPTGNGVYKLLGQANYSAGVLAVTMTGPTSFTYRGFYSYGGNKAEFVEGTAPSTGNVVFENLTAFDGEISDPTLPQMNLEMAQALYDAKDTKHVYKTTTGIAVVASGGPSGAYCIVNVLLQGFKVAYTYTYTTRPSSESNPSGINWNFLYKYSSDNTSQWDTTPTSGSTKPVTSGGIFDALAGKVAFTGKLNIQISGMGNVTIPANTVTEDGIYNCNDTAILIVRDMGPAQWVAIAPSHGLILWYGSGSKSSDVTLTAYNVLSHGFDDSLAIDNLTDAVSITVSNSGIYKVMYQGNFVGTVLVRVDVTHSTTTSYKAYAKMVIYHTGYHKIMTYVGESNVSDTTPLALTLAEERAGTKLYKHSIRLSSAPGNVLVFYALSSTPYDRWDSVASAFHYNQDVFNFKVKGEGPNQGLYQVVDIGYQGTTFSVTGYAGNNPSTTTTISQQYGDVKPEDVVTLL